VKRFPSFLTCIFYIFPFFTPGKQPYFEISEMTTHTPCARDIWWTLADFASAFLSPGVNSRTELVPSPRAYVRPLARELSLPSNKRMEADDDKSSLKRIVKDSLFRPPPSMAGSPSKVILRGFVKSNFCLKFEMLSVRMDDRFTVSRVGAPGRS
jgi:hypothetical protein